MTGEAEERPAEAAVVDDRAARTERNLRLLTAAAVGLLLLAGFYTLYLAREVLLPIAVAFVFFIVLAPVVRRLERRRIPPALSAAVLVVGIVGGLGLGLYALSEPMAEWRDRAPGIMRDIERKLGGLRRSVEEAQKTSEKMQSIAGMADDKGKGPSVVVKQPSLLQRLLGGLQDFGVQLAIVLVLLYFMLASGDSFVEKLVKVLPTFADKRRAVMITRQVEQQVSTYLLTITLINLGLGACIAAGLWLLGLPNAFLWGAMAAVLNYVPFIGAALGAGIVGVVGLVSFDDLLPALAAPAVFVGLNMLESQFVTPSVLGRRFTINPVVIFASIVLWSWLWGVPGALLAVPLLVVLKALCDHIEALSSFGEFLRGRDP